MRGLQDYPYSRPRKKALLSCTLQSRFSFRYISASLPRLPRCHGGHGVLGSRLAATTHQTHLPGLYLSPITPTRLPALPAALLGNGSCIFPASTDYTGSFQYIYFLKKNFFFFQTRNKCFVRRCFTLPERFWLSHQQPTIFSSRY